MGEKQLRRLRSVIETDRLSLTCESLDLISKDISYVMEDYFNLTEKPKVAVSARNGEYLISVTAKADAVKAFSVMKK